MIGQRDIFDMLSDPALLEKVDKLRDLNITQHVALPQLVAVGDQSSGKSSLLESLSGIPFPKDQSLCTRHVTQIISRRAEVDTVTVRIVAGPHASDEHKKHVESFQSPVSSSLEFRNQFVGILKKANDRMGLRADLSTETGAVFSEDVLKIEVSGPKEDYLTIIDVPGIFRTTAQGTTTDDIKMVRDLVKRYIKDDRTIILAVLPSNVDIATQEILQLAEEVDPNGERTLGVLTKPDLVIEPGAQAAVCSLVQGKKRPLTLGYYLIRNRGYDDLREQSQLDQTLRTEPWIDLPPERVGTLALKKQLRTLLVEITRREFPKLLQEVNNQIKECKKELQILGPSRQDEREQRSFLSQIAGAFQNCARAALAADYNVGSIFDQDELRLITHVVNITDIFNVDIHQNGHSRNFESLSLPQPSLDNDIFEIPDCDEPSLCTTAIERQRARLQQSNVDSLTLAEQDELAELSDLVITPRRITLPRDGFADWIDAVYFKSRGLDLGTFNAHLVTSAFAEQSVKWHDMTKLYMRRVIITLHRFIRAALRSVFPEEHGRDQLWSEIRETLVERYRMAVIQANQLIEIEKRKPPYTLNRQFAESLSKARGYRIAELLRPKARKDKQYGGPQLMVNLDDIVRAAEDKSNREQLQDEIHDILHAYYGLALDRFIDNVFQLPVDYQLLHGPNSPLKVFDQEWVINLESEQLERIAGETKSVKKHRKNMSKKIEDLTKALKILRTY